MVEDTDLAAAIPSSDAPALDEHAQERVRRWMEALLDLTLRNQLLAFRRESARVIQINAEDLGKLEDALALGKRIEVRGKDFVGTPDTKATRLGSSLPEIVSSPLNHDDVFSRAVHVDRLAKRELEEGGAWTLYIALGLLRWVQAGAEKTERYAPLLMVPVTFEIDRSRRRVSLLRYDDETLGNPTLAEYMRRDYGIDLSCLDELREDDAGVDVAHALQAVAESCSLKPQWQVQHLAYLGCFSFHKLIMWRDLRDYYEPLLAGGVARLIAEKPRRRYERVSGEVDRLALDDELPSAELPLVLDADSTQIAAIRTALRGENCVLQGPPGTGKSQTITNLIAAALVQGKRVLFVSEKMAALSVVYRRLSEAGLAPYCLELHSNRARKTDVLRSLESAWNSATPQHALDRASLEWATAGAEVDRRRAELNQYVRSIHAPSALCQSYRGITSRLIRLEQTKAPCLPIDTSGAGPFTDARLAQLLQMVEDFAAAATAVQPWEGNPYQNCKPESASAALDSRFREALREVINSIAAFEDTKAQFDCVLEIASSRSLSVFQEFVKWTAEAMTVPAIPEIADDNAWQGFRTQSHTLLDQWAAQNERRARLTIHWTEGIFEHVDLHDKVERWAGRFFLLAWFVLFGVRRQLRRVVRKNLPSLTRIAEDLAIARDIQGFEPRLEAIRTSWAARLEGIWDGSSWQALNEILDKSDRLRQRAKKFTLECTRTVLGVVASQTSSHKRTVLADLGRRAGADAQRLQVAASELFAAASLGPTLSPDHDSEAFVSALSQIAEKWQTCPSGLREVALYREHSRKVASVGLGALVQAHKEGRLDASQFKQAAERAVLDSVRIATEDNTEFLRVFQGNLHHQRVVSFQQEDNRLTQRARNLVKARLGANTPPRAGSPGVRGSEISILDNELRKKKRHMPIRRLFREAPELIRRLKPCLLMSPLSVAQYLPPQREIFDLVVFDEASQIPVPDAIGAIARGKQVVVVGDSRQMPPTSFFRGRGDDDLLDDSDQTTDLESVLDESLAVGLPEVWLKWHYRSRHASLISYSNDQIYEGRLEIFPSALHASDDLGVELQKVSEGVYRGKGVNPTEAKALVNYLCKRLRSFAPGSRSFGVLTFGISQCNEIADLLEEARAKDPVVDSHFDSALQDPLFVKNLENVQGDERDEILISVTYAPDEQGKMSMFFGPLSHVGGERRLNVAITRARKKMVVFTSMDSRQIDPSRTQAQGSLLLKGFLNFVERGRSPDTCRGEITTEEFDSDFERQVYDEVAALGFTVHPQVGVGGYKIDLGVIDPEVPGRFILGIECDGAAYHSGVTARDRDRLRQQVLQSLGWRLHRVWSTDWWYRRTEEISRLRAAIQEAQSTPLLPIEALSCPEESDLVEEFDSFETSAELDDVSSYSAFDDKDEVVRDRSVVVRLVKRAVLSLDLEPMTAQSFFDHRNKSKLHNAIYNIVGKEGPIHGDELSRKFVEHTGVKRMTPKWAEYVWVLAAELQSNVVIRGSFLWSPGVDPDDYWVVRSPAAKLRNLDTICDEEIAAAHAASLIRNLALPSRELHRVTARCFGLERLRVQAEPRLDAGLQALLRRSVAHIDGGMVRWLGRD